MESIINRHRNYIVFGAVLFVQLFGLAYQVKRTTDHGSARLVRVWAVTAITPFEKAFVHSVSWGANTWQNYFYLRDVRRQNQKLREEIQRLRLEQVRLAEDADQARRLQTLLAFKEQFISQTMAAQVISSTGSEFSRGVYIDKGSRDGIKADMPVITPDGILGKVLRVYPTSSLVLEINDPSSGAGVILQKSRLQGILKGDQSRSGETWITNIMSDEKVEPGDTVLTSGGDRVYPKGLPVGVVDKVLPGPEAFLKIKVHPAAQLDRVEEVLVITKIVEKSPDTTEQAEGPVRAVDILAQRLPSVPQPNPEDKDKTPPTMAELIAREKAAQKAAGGKQSTVDSRQSTVGSRQSTVDGRQSTEAGPQAAGMGKQTTAKTPEKKPGAPKAPAKMQEPPPAQAPPPQEAPR